MLGARRHVGCHGAAAGHMSPHPRPTWRRARVRADRALSLVVRGAVLARRARFPIPLSNRACDLPAHGLPMVFRTWLRGSRIADGPTEAMEAVALKPFPGPGAGLAGRQVSALPLDEQAAEPVDDVSVQGIEHAGGVAGSKVGAPAPQDRVDRRDRLADVGVAVVPAGPGLDLLAQPLLGSLAGPALEVIAADAALQEPTRHTGMEVAAQEVEARPTVAQVNDLRLVRMQLEAELGQDRSRPNQRRRGLTA